MKTDNIFEGKDDTWIERFKESLYYIIGLTEAELQRRKARDVEIKYTNLREEQDKIRQKKL